MFDFRLALIFLILGSNLDGNFLVLGLAFGPLELVDSFVVLEGLFGFRSLFKMSSADDLFSAAMNWANVFQCEAYKITLLKTKKKEINQLEFIGKHLNNPIYFFSYL